jgi:cytochrome c553/DNA-binding beta-propeller fold protein YncE
MGNARIGKAWVALCAGFAAIAGCPPGTTPGRNGNMDRNVNGTSNANMGGGANENVNLNMNAGTPAERGRVIYEGQRCINCHGFDGSGSPTFPGAPNIVGRTADNLQTALIEECEPPPDASALGNCHPLKLPDLSPQQLDDLAAYLATLTPTVPVEPGPPCDSEPGRICTVAGNGVPGNRMIDGILARDQFLFWPQNVTLDPQGRVVITDWNNYLIRRIEATGCRDGDCPIVNIIGTSGLGDSCSTAASPVEATAATMNHPVGVLYDDFILGESNIILWGWHMWKIKYIPVNGDGTTGLMYCLFGNARGLSGDGMEAGFNFDGMGGPTRFNLPSSCVYDNAGNFYISDQANLRIRRVLADGDDLDTSAEDFVASRQNNIIETFAGGLLDAAGNTRRTLPDYSDSGDGGPAPMCTFHVQAGFDAIPQMRLALDRDRNLLYVADSENNRIRVIDLATNIITTYAGGGDDLAADNVPATQARLFRPSDVDLDPAGSGDLLITDTFNHCARLVDFDTQTIRTVAGICNPVQTAEADESPYYSGDGGPATEARLQEPGGSYVADDPSNPGTYVVYIADTLNHRVRRVNGIPKNP